MILSADGCIDEAGAISFDDCCPLPLGQIDACALACSFVNLLPSGPMWDRAKAQMLDYYRQGNPQNACDFTCPAPELECQSVVAYAVYLSKVFLNIINGALWPALRESDPSTAVTTLDDWLARLGWQDCYKTACRDVLLGDLTPYEIQGVCGPVFCPVDTPPELECAVKRGIAQALTRANMGGIKNLCWMNWVIEPLGASLAPKNVSACTVNYPGKPCMPCDGPQFTICNVGTTLPRCKEDLSPGGNSAEADNISAVIRLRDCDKAAGMPSEIWPGVIAAECIVRSLLPVTCPNNIHRCC